MLAGIPAGYWLIAGGVALLMGMMMKQRANMRRRQAGVDLGEKRDERAGAKESMDEIFVQLQEFSRETLARLDTKIRALNELLARADAKIEELKRLSAAAPAAASAPPAKSANPLHEKVFRLKDEGKSPGDIAAATGLERGEVELILGLR